MNEMKFFLDTADLGWLKTTWAKLYPKVPVSALAGVTTNPSAFAKKAELKHLNEWRERSIEILQWMGEIQSEGTLYVQSPNSNMSRYELISYANMLNQWHNDSGCWHSQIGMKISPKRHALLIAGEVDISINVTGVAECATALYASSFEFIDYVSIIPGRMEQAGLDANSQMEYIMSANLDQTEIITGAMRTVQGVRDAVERGTVPTIGTGVMDLILEDIGVDGFVELWDVMENIDHEVAPEIKSENTKLAIDFFAEMDGWGETAYADFLKLGDEES